MIAFNFHVIVEEKVSDEMFEGVYHMKKVKVFIFFLTIGLVFAFSTISIRADVGPKPSVIVEITGVKGEKYAITFLGKEPTPPYSDENYDHLDDHPIMDFTYGEYKFVGRYWEKEGNDFTRWTYYPPSPFRILVRLEDGSYYISEELERYTFSSYYHMDLSDVTRGEPGSVTVVTNVRRSYNYSKEIWNFIFRLALTIAIELVIALLFKYRGKYLWITIIVNIITQIFLNLTLSLNHHYNGALTAILLLIVAEISVLLIEAVIYGITLRKKGILRALLYTVVANVVTFLVTFIGYLPLP